jgi:hypothetical protein
VDSTKPPTRRASWTAPAALVLALLSLGLNALLLSKLRHPERMIEPALDRVASRLATSDAAIRYTVRIPAGTPVQLDIPIDQSYTVKLRASLPINTTVRMAFNTPFGQRTVSVPVRTTIPVRQDFPVRLVDTFHLRTETRTAYVVPLEIKLKDLPLDALKDAVKP